jgi:hypothetical protein
MISLIKVFKKIPVIFVRDKKINFPKQIEFL